MIRTCFAKLGKMWVLTRGFLLSVLLAHIMFYTSQNCECFTKSGNFVFFFNLSLLRVVWKQHLTYCSILVKWCRRRREECVPIKKKTDFYLVRNLLKQWQEWHPTWSKLRQCSLTDTRIYAPVSTYKFSQAISRRPYDSCKTTERILILIIVCFRMACVSWGIWEWNCFWFVFFVKWDVFFVYIGMQGCFSDKTLRRMFF